MARITGKEMGAEAPSIKLSLANCRQAAYHWISQEITEKSLAEFLIYILKLFIERFPNSTAYNRILRFTKKAILARDEGNGSKPKDTTLICSYCNRRRKFQKKDLVDNIYSKP